MRKPRWMVLLLILAACRQPGSRVRGFPSGLEFPPGKWVSLFDGRTLRGWRVAGRDEFERHGAVEVETEGEAGAILLGRGDPATGIAWRGPLLRDRYEIALEARRVEGRDFFCGLTFPVADEPCTLILGGWGGEIVGLSNVDNRSAAENESTLRYRFENGIWYAIRLRVGEESIAAWIDEERVIELPRFGKVFTVWSEQEHVRPLGVTTWKTAGAVRALRFRRLEGEAAER